MDITTKLGMIGQWGSLILTFTGLVVMLMFGATIWHDFVTGGALLLTLSTKIRYYKEVYRPNRRRKKLVSINTLIDDGKKANKASS